MPLGTPEPGHPPPLHRPGTKTGRGSTREKTRSPPRQMGLGPLVLLLPDVGEAGTPPAPVQGWKELRDGSGWLCQQRGLLLVSLEELAWSLPHGTAGGDI